MDSLLNNPKKHNWPIHAVGWAWRIVMAGTLAIVLFCQSWEYGCKVELPWKNGLCLLVGAAGLIALFLLAHLASGHLRKRSHRLLLMGGLSLLTGVGIFWCAVTYAFTPGWDVAVVFENACDISLGFTETLSNDYYSQYPNNVLYTVLLALVYRLGDALGMRQSYFLALGLQCAGYALVLFLTYVNADLLLKKEKSPVPLWCWGTALLLVGISPWVAVQYTDSAALILVSVITWTLLKTIREPKWKPLWAGLTVALSRIAFSIKPQALILLIAAALIAVFSEGLQCFRRERLRRTGAVLLACCVGMGAGIGTVRLVESKSGFQLDPERYFGPEHFLMMGLNTKTMGVYNQDDVNYSTDIATAEKRRAKNLSKAEKRLQKMGVSGVWEQAVRKTLTNYSDATFGWEREGGFYSYDTYYFPAKNPWMAQNIPPFYIAESYTNMVDYSCSNVWRTLEQCVWLGVLALGLFSYRRRAPDRAVAVLQLAILGLSLFELLFEARSRYLFSYAPVYILLAGVGMENGRAWLAARRHRGG